MKRTNERTPKRTIGQAAICLAVLLALYLLPGCSNENDPAAPPPAEESKAPELPSIETMKFTVDFFGVEPPAVSPQSIQVGKPGDELLQTAEGDHANWINAFIRVLFLQLLMFDALDEPIGAFAYAIHSTPRLQPDGSWLWTYIFVEGDAEYSVFLYGTPMTDRVGWRMEVSTNVPEFLLDHFVWFEGQCMKNESSGYWQFYDPILESIATTEGVETARIDWENTSRSEHRLTVTINGESQEDYGDTLEFYQSSTMGSVDHYDASEDARGNITWYPDGSGSITVTDYNDGLQACWDINQENTDC